VNKSDIIHILSQRYGQIPSRDIELAVKAMVEQMAETLSSGDRIEIRGFGSFSIRYRQPRVARNPKTGSRVELDSKYVPHFKPGKDLRDMVNHSAQGDS
jgi:integration host factor subunit beta